MKRLVALLVLFLQSSAQSPTSEAIRLNNIGSARMHQQRGDDALKLFEQAYVLDSKFLAARLNQGIALLAMQRLEPARDVLLEVTRLHPNQPRAWYNLGLVYRSMGQSEDALRAFTRVTELDAGDADSLYFVGVMESQLRRYDRALAAFERAVAIAPYHASGEFGMARAYQLSGDATRAAEHLTRFQHLTQDRLGVPLGSSYGDQGKYSLVEEITSASGSVPAAIRVHFTASTLTVGAVSDRPGRSETAPTGGAGGCFIDFDSDGRQDVFLMSTLYRNNGNGKFVDVTTRSGLNLRGEGFGCAVADFNNDGLPDLAASFSDRIVLLKNAGDGRFQDVTREAGINTTGPSLGLTFIDFDHDGDVDLFAANRLWRNNGNGTFTDVTQTAGFGSNASTVSVVATDFNNDRAIDFLITRAAKAPGFAVNPREGPFHAVEPWTTPMPPDTLGAAVLDFDKDGWMDVAFTHATAPGLTLWRNVAGKRFERVSIPDLKWDRGWGLTAIDYDNDGWLDLAAVGEAAETGQIRVLRNRGAGGFEDVTTAVGLDALKLRNPRALITADVDNDGDSDFLITQNNGPVVLLRNDGGNQNNWIRLTLKGLNDNKSGIGTKLEVFAGSLWQKWEVQSSSGYLGQNALEVRAGLGALRNVDLVRILWPTGVPQDEEQAPIRQTRRMDEIDRRGSSCPILFTWNGKEFEFITDVIGAGVVGHWEGPGKRNISDPTEYIKIEGRQLQERNGRLSLRFLEPMEELVYLDQVRLLAVDHPAGIAVYPNEYFAATAPFPEFKVIASQNAHPPLAAWDDKKHDVLPELLKRDRRYVTGFASQSFPGFAELHTLELDLGDTSGTQPLRLLMHGFIDYFSATSVFAAHQAGVEAIVPYLEAQDSAGKWIRVVDDMGFPAGLARTMVADLTGRLPAGTRRVRIGANLKIYWDQILIDRTPGGAPARLTEIPLVDAKLSLLGYPRAIEGNPRSDVSYDYSQISATGPYARHAGAYTRYGDVLSLVSNSDDQFAIFGSGEQVAIEFDSSTLPALQQGWVRDYFFYADGFDKDMDFYAAYAQTVEPLPFHNPLPYPYLIGNKYPVDPNRLNYQLEYNSRHLSGNPTSQFQFRY